MTLSDYMLFKVAVTLRNVVADRRTNSDTILSGQKLFKRKETYATDFPKIKTYSIMLVNGYEHELKINLN